MTTNRWTLGVPYDPTMNGVPFWTQPDGPYTKVFPQMQNNAPWPEYPVPGLVINEYAPFWSPACQHPIKEWKIIQEFDYDSNQAVSLICCNVCTLVQNVHPLNGGAVADFRTQNVYNPYQNAIIMG